MRQVLALLAIVAWSVPAAAADLGARPVGPPVLVAPPPAAEVRVVEPLPPYAVRPNPRRFLHDVYWGSYRPWWGPNCYWRYGYQVCRP
ncbi:hypothetical protein [Prosthecomicrobium sp. N25]|uniref:hypothetical protein n=1 Tax=Prosthecomicrobium sp. N25 TaxID=3129254 RepID=UPI003077F7BC